MKVAAWQYPIERLPSFAAWRAKIEAAAAEAARAGAAVLVAPEYASMELTALLAPDEQATLETQLAGIQRLIGDHDAAYRDAAASHGIAIVASSVPVRMPDGTFRNQVLVHARGGRVGVQKLQMTRFEREQWGISPGDGQAVIDLGDGVRLGVAICYDVEFPLIVRRLCAAGANVIAVPSCTDTLAGYHRVRVSSQARALENQCYVVQAATVGMAPWSIAVDENVGAGGVFAPSDRGFPDDGVVAAGALNAPGLVIAELELARLVDVRRDGQVFNDRDWDLPRHHAGDVTRIRI